MQSQMAGIYRAKNFYLLHAMEQSPPGFWVAAPPFERLSEDVADVDLGNAALLALDRSRPMRDYQPSRAPRDTELIKAAGFRSRKQFIAASTMCTLEQAVADRSTIQVRPSRRDVSNSAWISEPDTIGVNASDLGAIGAVIRSVLSVQ